MSAVVEMLPDGSARLQFTFDRWVVDQLKLKIPASERHYFPPEKTWAIRAPWVPTAIGILGTAFADEIEIIAPRAAPATPSTIATDPVYAELCLLPTAPNALVRVAYRELAKLHHPDRGGDTAAMQKINRAFETLQARGVA